MENAIPTMPKNFNRLTDLSKSNLEKVLAGEVEAFFHFTNTLFIKHKVIAEYVAIYVTDELGFGLSRMFETFREFEKTSESLRLFRTKQNAINWVKKGVDNA